jgi:hypothetical protein
MCEYGTGCSRPDCIYRHDDGGKSEEFCLPFLAGKCTFTEQGCKKRHPKKEDSDRLIAKYKRTRCRFGDECYTESCLYLHPREVEETEPHFVEPHHVAFPPLNGASGAAPKPVANSAWKAAPAVAPPCVKAEAPAWFPTPHQAQMCAPYDAPPAGMHHAAHSDMAYYEEHGTPPKDATTISFNANAKEFVPGSFA